MFSRGRICSLHSFSIVRMCVFHMCSLLIECVVNDRMCSPNAFSNVCLDTVDRM